MDEKNKGSVYSPAIKTAIEKIPEDIASLSDEELEKKVNPTLKMYEIKRQFWKELGRAQSLGQRMKVCNVYNGVIAESAFYNRILSNTLRVAWLIAPLSIYDNRTKAALDKVTARYEELITMDITTKKFKNIDGETVEWTEIDPRKANVLLSVIKNLEDRIHGTAIQRQVSVSTKDPSGTDSSASLNMDKVDDRLKELEYLLEDRMEEDSEAGRECVTPENGNDDGRKEGFGAEESDGRVSDGLAQRKDGRDEVVISIEQKDIREL